MTQTTIRKMVKPGEMEKGKFFQVYLPDKKRNVNPQGESLVITPYLERRISSGELVVMEQKKPASGGEK